MHSRDIFRTNDIPGYLVVRLALGYVFLVAGIQKFIFPERMGPGRFAEIGVFPAPELTAYVVGTLEIGCAVLILLGLVARLAAIPLAVIMCVAIATTKIPLLPEGFWGFAHALRLDLVMLLLAILVVINGADRRSLDHRLPRRGR